MSHGITVCRSCGDVLARCRCMGPHVVEKKGLCEKCRALLDDCLAKQTHHMATDLVRIGAWSHEPWIVRPAILKLSAYGRAVRIGPDGFQ